MSGVLQSGTVASVHLKGGTANGTGFLFEIHGTEGALSIVPADPRQTTYIQVSEFIVRGAQAGKPLADLSIPKGYGWVPPAVPARLPFNVAQLYTRMAEGIREGKSVSPDFDVAVRRHQLLDVIQKASDTGLRQCLLDTHVDVVQTVGRTPTGVQHPKVREVVEKDVHGLM